MGLWDFCAGSMDWTFCRDIVGRRLCLSATPWAWTSSIHWHVCFMLGCQNLGAFSAKGMLSPKWHLRLVLSFLCFKLFIYCSVFWLKHFNFWRCCVCPCKFCHFPDLAFKFFYSNLKTCWVISMFELKFSYPLIWYKFGYLSSELGVLHVHNFVVNVWHCAHWTKSNKGWMRLVGDSAFCWGHI